MVPGKDYIAILTKVRGRKRDHCGNIVGNPNNNPIIGVATLRPSGE